VGTVKHNTVVQIQHLGLRHYSDVLRDMRDFSAERGVTTRDAFWLVQHYPVFTLGRNGKVIHILDAGGIPVVASDRGGQVTYHGPGQIVVYVMLDVRRLGLGVRHVVSALELAVIDLLAHYKIVGNVRANAPGVYVDGRKISALGLRIKNGKSYHGLSLNVAMDLSPFKQINPCGMAGLEVTQLADLMIEPVLSEVENTLLTLLAQQLGFKNCGE